LHEDAVALFATPPAKWCTSVLVVSETYSWFLHRLGEEAARVFRRLLDDLPHLRILDTSRSHRKAVADKLDALRGTKLTYVDASSLVFIAERGIARVLGTDHHLAIEGATVVPGSPVR
jgi:predicted nucleic acid-binding protein